MKEILHKLTYAQNPSQYEAYPSYYEEILCKVLTVWLCFFVTTLPEYLSLRSLGLCGVGSGSWMAGSVSSPRKFTSRSGSLVWNKCGGGGRVEQSRVE